MTRIQCTNGHLMCAGCFNHLLADARLRDENATCPNCRVDISKTSVSRNLAVEKALSELPSECQFCAEEYPRNSVVRHEQSQCEERYDDYSCFLLFCATSSTRDFFSQVDRLSVQSYWLPLARTFPRAKRTRMQLHSPS